MAEVEVAAPGSPGPAQEDVRGRLHRPLADDDTLALVGALSVLEVGGEDRGLGLLRLEDERVAFVATLEDDDEATGSDAADSDDLEGRVGEPVALEEVAPVLRQRRAVIGEHLRQGRHPTDIPMLDDRRVIDDHPASLDHLGERLEGAHPVAAAGLGEDRLEALAAAGTRLAPDESGGLGRRA